MARYTIRRDVLRAVGTAGALGTGASLAGRVGSGDTSKTTIAGGDSGNSEPGSLRR